MESPRINYDALAPVSAERDRAQKAVELVAQRYIEMRAAMLRIAAIVETQAKPDIDAIHDIVREALNNEGAAGCTLHR